MTKITDVFYTDSFIKDLKANHKRHKGIARDFDRFLASLIDAGESYGAVRISDLGECYSNTPVWKAKKFRCTEMKGKGNRSGYRIVYIEFEGALVFVQFYYKKDNSTNHDPDLIRDTLDRLYDDRLYEMTRHTGPTCQNLLSKK